MRRRTVHSAGAAAPTMPAPSTVLGAGYDWDRSDAYEADELLAIVDELARDNFYGERHPVGQRFLGGDLTPDEMRFLATQEYAYYKETTWWNAGKLLNSAELEEQRRLHGALLDELGTDLMETGGAAPHAEMFLRYCEGLGLSRTEVTNAPLVPSVVLAVTELRRIASHRPVFEMLVASNLVIEKQRPRYYSALLRTFAEHYSWVPRDALLFYEVHAEHDVDHESRGRQIVRTYLGHKWQQDLAMSAALRSVGLRLVMYDGIQGAMQGDSVFVHRWPCLPDDPWPRPTTAAATKA
jgi:pyrroloquinoline quinone (PQQ) biosynthesis protein C